MVYFALPYKAYDAVLANADLRKKVYLLGYPQRSNKWAVHFEDWTPVKYKEQAKRILEELKEAYKGGVQWL